MDRPHVVVIGAGFGGLTLAQSLAGAPVRITVLDRTNHHLFQPLLYQVAMAGLSPAEIAAPVRGILSAQANVAVLLEEVVAVDLAEKTVTTDAGQHTYDFLVIATGAKTDYFGHAEWEKHAPGLKSIEDAVDIRRRVLMAFEKAERATDGADTQALLTFVVVGGGPTGVELAGAVAELSRHVLASDFRTIDPRKSRVLLVEGSQRVLESFPETVSASARAQLEEIGVELVLGERVTAIDEGGVTVGDRRIESSTVLWAAGVRATRLTERLGVDLDRGGRIKVQPDCSVPGHPSAFAIGDTAFLADEKGVALPGVSPVAMQQARYVAHIIDREARDGGDEPRRQAFRYFDKGSMATIGRSRAVAVAKGMELSGFTAWMAWLFVHLWYLVGFRNRVAVFLNWTWSYLTYARGARLITGRAVRFVPSSGGSPARD